MHIRPETSADIAAIRAVNVAAFPTPAEADLVDWLRADGDAVLSLVAEADGAVIGHVLFSRMEAPFRALGLAPVAVMPAWQRRGIGSRLIERGLAAARAGGWDGAFVLGDTACYRRFGFSAERAAGFSSAYAGPHFMALAFGKDGFPATSGDVAYAPAFSRIG